MVAVFTATVGGQQTFRAGVDLVTFGVTVVDRKGNLVTDLTRDDFEAIEDGRRHELQYFAFGDGDTAPPLHLGLMLDASGSMQSDLKLAQSASIKFLNLLPQAEVGYAVVLWHPRPCPSSPTALPSRQTSNLPAIRSVLYLSWWTG